MIVLQAISDTVYVKNLSNSSDTPFLTVAVASIISAIIGGLVVVWTKAKEFGLQRENLELQRQNLEHAIKNTENTLKAEVLKIREIQKNTKLNATKQDFDKMKDLLQKSSHQESEENKFAMFVTEVVSKNLCELPPFIEDDTEYKDTVATHIHFSMEALKVDLSKLLKINPTIFVTLQDEIKAILNLIDNVERKQFSKFSIITQENIDFQDIVDDCLEEYVSIYEKTQNLMTLLQNDYREIETLKKLFIQANLKK